MADYPYSTELKKPYSVGAVNFEKPIALRVLKRIVAVQRALANRFKAPPGTRLSVIRIPGWQGDRIPCHVLEPDQDERNLPVVVYYHGGAFVIPVQDMMLRHAAEFASQLSCRIFIPDYRLVPDHPFPTPLEDAYSALIHILAHATDYRIDPDRLLLYGESAGGALVAGVTHLLRDRGAEVKPLGQLLIYPVTDHSMQHVSVDEYPDALWSRSANRHMWNLYLKNGDSGRIEDAAPLNRTDFSGLPPAYVEPAEIDVLRDEAIAYAEKLRQAGIPTELNVITGAYHGFERDVESPLVQRVLAYRLTVMRRMLGL